MPFTTAVVVSAPITEKDLWEVLVPLNFRSKRIVYANGNPKNYVVAPGFKSDLATVPRIPIVYWWVGGRGPVAAVVHDWLYTHGMRLKQIKDRQEADDIYLEILLEAGLNDFLAETMYWGVCTFGEKYFHDAT